MRTVYGPIESWRFGRSLGIDPLGGRSKKCPLSCIYCQYGPTSAPVFQRRAWVTAGQLARDLEALGEVPCDCVTFAGLGEPTLAANIRELVRTVRQRFAVPVIVLTGSGMLPRDDVRADLASFDAVVTKLDAPDEVTFRRVNRPQGAYPYSFDAVLQGLQRLREERPGRFVVQTMLVQTNKDLVAELASLVRALRPDEVQLDTPLQPALGGPVSEAEMREAEKAFAGLPVRTVYEVGIAQIKPRMM